jgi:hypothetical protein
MDAFSRQPIFAMVQFCMWLDRSIHYGFGTS